MKKPYVLFYFILALSVCSPISLLAQTNTRFQIPDNAKVGILSAFPEPNGMFHSNRAIYLSILNKKPLFPRHCTVEGSVNQYITNYLTKYLSSQYIKHTFISIPSIKPREQLSGYLTEGVLETDTESIGIEGIKKIFDAHKIDYLIAVVPATYYIPFVKHESTGFGLGFVFSKNSVKAYGVYGVIVYKRTNTLSPNNSFSKAFNSYKQIFYMDIGTTKEINLNNSTYSCHYLDVFHQEVQTKFLPYLGKQVSCMLNTDKLLSTCFKKPSVPFSYYIHN